MDTELHDFPETRGTLYLRILNSDKQRKIRRDASKVWDGYGDGYVLPMETIDVDKNETVVFQNPHVVEPTFSVSETKEQWRNNM